MPHSLLDILEPSTYAQVQKHPQWYQAMSDEFNTLIQDQTWDLIHLNLSQNVIVVRGFSKSSDQNQTAK